MSRLIQQFRVLVRALRVYQWTKNLLVFAALLFAKQVGDPVQLSKSIAAFAAFCMAASATYLLNDLIDIEKDRNHPKKRLRPLPSGELTTSLAWVMSAGLFAASITLAGAIRFQFLLALLFFICLTVAYSVVLKEIIIVDVMAIALGFVARAMGGALVLNVVFSNWLVVCTLFLAMFLGLSKRRHEITLMVDGAQHHRRVLYHYSVNYLDQLILIVASGALITYTIYTCSQEVVNRIGTDKLYLTIPFVVYGLFRYLFLVHHRTGGGDPSDMLLTDVPLGINVLLWAVSCGAIIYWA